MVTSTIATAYLLIVGVTPGDNPSYGARSGGANNDYQEGAEYQEIPARTQNSHQQSPTASTTSLKERDFDNPLYGDDNEEVQEREFKNPIYGADDYPVDEEAESEDPYTIPSSPPSNVYDRVADDHRVRVAVTSTTGSGSGLYSTINI